MTDSKETRKSRRCWRHCYQCSQIRHSTSALQHQGTTVESKTEGEGGGVKLMGGRGS